MSWGMHSAQYQSDANKKYKRIASLINIVEASDTIHIDYTKLDSKTAGAVKDTIANVLHKDLELEIKDDTKKYIEKVFKENMTTGVSIDFAKIDDEELMLAYGLKREILDTLRERKREIYFDMSRGSNY